MLDAPNLDYADVLTALEARQPDPRRLAEGDAYARLAVRCYASELNSAQIAGRLLALAGLPFWHDDAATAVARHYARAGMSFTEIIEVLVHLAVEAPGWLDDPDAIANLARFAIAEAAAT